MQNESIEIVTAENGAQREQYVAPAIEDRVPLVGVLCGPGISPTF
jgi:hypothetical protein